MNAVASWNIIRNKIPLFLVSPMDLLMSNITADEASMFGFDVNNMYSADGAKAFESGILDQLKFLQHYRASVILPLSVR